VSEMIELVTRAIEALNVGDDNYFVKGDDAKQIARAAISAMRDIPEDVLVRGWVDRFSDGKPLTVARWRENWEGVIDEALK
jgi:hypothetical protein